MATSNMIRLILALLMAGHVLSVPVDGVTEEAVDSTPVPEKNEVPSAKEALNKPSDTALTKPGSDLETAPSVWYSYHHSLHSVPPLPLILPRSNVYTTYYAHYAPYSYWSTW